MMRANACLVFCVVWTVVFWCSCEPIAVESKQCTTNADCFEAEGCYQGSCRQICNRTDECLYRHDYCHEGYCIEMPDASMADASADAELNDTNQDLSDIDADLMTQDAFIADGGFFDAVQPDTNAPDTFRPDTNLPDTYRPDTTVVDDFCLGSDVVLRQHLDGSTSGTRSGGTYTSDGWRTDRTSDKIFWNLGTVLSSGSIEFEAKGFHADVGGCFAGVCYYVGLFEEANGDKAADYTGSAFIESRFHNNLQENFHDTIKLQAGIGDGSMQEPMIPPGLGWTASQWHRFRIEWGAGRSKLFIDGAQRLQANYSTSRSVAWQYLFLGTTNYKGAGWAATNVTYRDLCVRR